MLLFRGLPPPTIFLLPLVLIPFILMTLGFGWILASVGVYVRDISQVISVGITVLMFLSPLFYSISALPEAYQFFMLLNPLTFVIEQARAAMIFGAGFSWLGWAIYLSISVLVAWGVLSGL
jgi:lipopolysaccharide transport system permease protein